MGKHVMSIDDNANHYDAAFYKWQSTGSYCSAQIVIELIASFIKPQSVIDLGCGIGTWLKAFQEAGVSKIQGIDGSWIKQNDILISRNVFSSGDLTRPVSLPGATYDMSMSVEVAEHLPEEASEDFVASLCNLSPVVLFSAATPGQGGKNHINEQWQSYWARKFMSHGYVPYDVIRPEILGNPEVEWWYQQNIILYVRKEHELTTKLNQWERKPEQLDWVHPKVYQSVYRKAYRPKLRELIKKIPSAISSDIQRNINRKIKTAP